MQQRHGIGTAGHREDHDRVVRDSERLQAGIDGGGEIGEWIGR
ncbi:MAG TPA: hypothetical protein VM253_06730 [Candidatus Limnocylindrales bacterium]|nr:hypothetical protein [Candidatus Limnocylindrales bacterium]